MKTASHAIVLLSILWTTEIAVAQEPFDRVPTIEIPEYSTTIPTSKFVGNGIPIIFIPHFPTSNKDWRMSKMQQAFGFAIEKIRVDKREIPLDLSESFLNDQAILNRELIPDGAHPGIKGYAAWQTGMEPTLLKLLDAD